MKYLKISILSVFILLYASFVFAANRFIDNTNTSGDLSSANWDFVKDSATVTCPGDEGDANNEIVNGDYVRAEGGTQWYVVIDRTVSGDEITIDPAFQQANTGAVACNYADVSTNDGTTKEKAWVHPALFTTDTVRTPGDGDIGYMRSGQTHVLAGKDLVADEDGTAAARTVLMGDDGTLFEEGDGGHVTFDFSDTAFQCLWQSDNYWQLENIDIIQSADTLGGLYIFGSDQCKIIDCVVRDCGNIGLHVNNCGWIEVHDSAFYSNTTYSCQFVVSLVKMYNSVLNGGVAGTVTGIFYRSGFYYLEDCTLGVTTAHSTRDIYIAVSPATIITRRCILASAIEVTIVDTAAGSYLKSEDHDQVEGAHKSYYWNGTIEKETTEVRSGGAATSIKATPNSNTVPNFPLMLMEWEEQAVPASEQTRGIAIKQGLADPTGFPTNTELYLEAEYYDHASNDTVTTAVSTATISVYDTWTWFPVTFTPAQVQKVRYRVILKTIESSEAYYVDDKLYPSDPTGVVIANTLDGHWSDGESRSERAITSVNVIQISGDSTAADNLESQYDTTGLAGDTFPSTQAQLSNITNTGSAVHKTASSYTLTTGTQSSGTYASTAALDGTSHEHTDVGNEMDLYYEFLIGSGIPTSVRVTGYLTGVNDDLEIHGYDWVASGWVQIGAIHGKAQATNEVNAYDVFVNMVGSGSDIGKVRIRFTDGAYTLSTATLVIDQIFVAFSSRVEGYENGAIWIDTTITNTNTVVGVDGTPGNPVSTIAAANTLSASTNLNRFRISPGSTITFAVSQDNQVFVGHNWALALGGVSISSSHIIGASSVTGTATGAVAPTFVNCMFGNVTLPPSHLNFCGFDGTITIGSAGEFTFESCHSMVGGTSTPVLDFGSGLNASEVNMRHYSGGIDLRYMGAGSGSYNMSLEGDGQLIINANCSAISTIAIRGNFKITNNATGITLVYDDDTSKLKRLR